MSEDGVGVGVSCWVLENRAAFAARFAGFGGGRLGFAEGAEGADEGEEGFLVVNFILKIEGQRNLGRGLHVGYLPAVGLGFSVLGFDFSLIS